MMARSHSHHQPIRTENERAVDRDVLPSRRRILGDENTRGDVRALRAGALLAERQDPKQIEILAVSLFPPGRMRARGRSDRMINGVNEGGQKLRFFDAE